MLKWLRLGKKKTEAERIAEEQARVNQLVEAAMLESGGKIPLPGKINLDYNQIIRKSIQVTPEHFKFSNGATLDSAGGEIATAPFANTGTSQGLPLGILNWYASQGFIGYQACSILAQHWLIDKACSMPAEDAVRNGYELTVNDGSELPIEVQRFIREKDQSLNLNKNLVEFVRCSRIFGYRIALFVVDSDDPEYYEKPFNIDGVKAGAYRGISQVDPYWIIADLNFNAVARPGSIHFYEPTYWQISGKKYHRSHFVITRHAEPTDLLKPSYLWGGIPLTQQIYERVYSAERIASEALQLTMTKRLYVQYVDPINVASAFGSFEKGVEAFAAYQDNYGTKFVNTEDKVEKHDTALADLDAVIMTQYQLVAAVAGVPATKLIETNPKGFNATGEHEQANYFGFLQSIRDNKLAPLLQRHYQLLTKSYLEHKFHISPLIVAKFKPLDSPTALETAQIRLTNAQADSAWGATGAIDGYEIRKRLTADESSGFNGLQLDESIDDPLTETDIEENGPGLNEEA